MILLSITTYGQKQNNTDYVEGEVLVQLTNASEISLLENHFDQYNLQSVQTVSARFNIFLLHFNPAKSTHSNLLNALHLEKSVLNAQNNHFVELRNINDTLPDDPRIGQQWPLKNTGQNGGLPDADIDADEAWDITTGGTTALGDEIVVAIIDGGSDQFSI